MKNNFTNKINELQDFNLEPNKEVWVEIEKQLPQEKKRRIVAWWWGLPIVLGLGLTTWLLSNNNKKEDFLSKKEDKISVLNEKISVFPHGIDTQKFTKMDKKAAKVSIGLQPNDFVVFNNNRNSYRKLWDITMKAFVRFWKLSDCRPDVKLLINCRMDISDGYNFHDIIHAACINEGVDFEKISNNNIILLSSTAGGVVHDSVINSAYNASDIGLNTCGGEGFGLCNAEAGFLGVPQIVTRTGGLADIFGKFENMLVDPKVYMTLTSGIDFHNGELAISSYKDFADKMYFYYKNRDIMQVDGKNLEQHIRSTYDWDTLLEKFLQDIERIVI